MTPWPADDRPDSNYNMLSEESLSFIWTHNRVFILSTIPGGCFSGHFNEGRLGSWLVLPDSLLRPPITIYNVYPPGDQETSTETEAGK